MPNRIDSLWWRDRRDLCSILSVDNLDTNWFSNVTQKQVGSGENILFWNYSWLGEQPLCSRLPQLFLLAENKDVKVVESRFWQDNSWHWNLFQTHVLTATEASSTAFLQLQLHHPTTYSVQYVQLVAGFGGCFFCKFML